MGIRVVTTVLAVSTLAACTTGARHPQTSSEFVSMMSSGGLFKNVEHVTVERPIKAVTADVSEYAKKCLAVVRTRAANYQLKEVGGSTTYRPKIQNVRPGVVTLSVQEDYGHPEPGAPADGLITFVAEFQPAAKNQTQIDIYYISTRGSIGDVLKEWATGNKRGCPKLSN
jgi:hypothetical protein